jgi:restriction system protein
MPVPDFETLMLPVLQAFAEGARNVSEVVPRLREEFGIDDGAAAEVLPSGRMTVLASRAHWARTFLSKAGLLTSPRRNVHEITDIGRALLAECPERIDNAVLERFDSFRAWRLASRTSISVGDVEELSPSPPRSSEPASATPEERAMSLNTFGHLFRVTTWGESHGPAIGRHGRRLPARASR